MVEAEILLTECTFFEDDHRRTAKAGRHLHVAEFAAYLPRLNCRHVVVLHVSRRTGVNRAKRLLEKHATSDAGLRRVHFLLDHGRSQERDEESEASASASSQVKARPS